MGLSAAGAVLYEYAWTYDQNDNVTALTQTVNGQSYSYAYAYNGDQQPASVSGGAARSFTYDGYGRLSAAAGKARRYNRRRRMEIIFSMLEKIRDNYGVYIGNASLSELATFLSGYECALYDLTGRRSNFDSAFQRFVEDRLPAYKGMHWAEILDGEYSPQRSFHAFFRCLSQFQAEGQGQSGAASRISET